MYKVQTPKMVRFCLTISRNTSSGAPEDLDVGASANLEETKHLDAESTYNPELPEDVPEVHKVKVSGSIDEVNTKKTPEYGSTMDLDVVNIDKNDNIHIG